MLTSYIAVEPSLKKEGATPSKLNALTSTRFFAAALIVIFHASNSTYVNPFLSKFPLHLGVSYFFVLSGFILTHVYKDMPPSGLKSFFINRFARVWPSHIFTLILNSVMFPVMLRSLTHSVITWPILVLNVLMLQSWIPLERIFFSLNSVSWSISTEFGFYLMFPLILAASKRHRLFLLLVPLVSIGLMLLSDQFGLQHSSKEFSLMTNPLVRLLEFASGIGFYFLYENFKDRLSFFLVSMLQIIMLPIIAYALITPITGSSSSFMTLMSEDVYIPIWGMTIAFLALDGLVSKILSAKWLVLLGEISFSMYLLHPTVLKTHMPLFLFPFVLLFTSWLSFKFIENPARRFLINKSKESNSRVFFEKAVS
jgi:peptidoglycan/LPS O-acetylase OafA/YrhL